MKTLLIEDDEGCTVLLRRIMHGLGHIETAATLNEALAKADHTFDLIWLDLGLPDSRPEETLGFISVFRATAPTSAILVASGYGEALREPSMRAGADVYAGKDDLGGFKHECVHALILQSAMKAFARGVDAGVILRTVCGVILKNYNP